MTRSFRRLLVMSVAASVLVSMGFFVTLFSTSKLDLLNWVLYVVGMPGLVVALIFGGGLHGGMPSFLWMAVGTVVNALIYTLVLTAVMWIRGRLRARAAT
jgi:hypothetical protein